MFRIYFHSPSTGKSTLIARRRKSLAEAVKIFLLFRKKYVLKPGDVAFISDTNLGVRYSLCPSDEGNNKYEFMIENSDGNYYKLLGSEELARELDVLANITKFPGNYGYVPETY